MVKTEKKISKRILTFLLVFLGADFFGVSGQAGVVGISPTISVSGTAAGAQNNPYMTFNTSATGNLIRMSGIGFYGLSTQTSAYNAVVVTVNATGHSVTGTINIGANTIGQENTILWNDGFDGYLLASKAYAVRFNSGVIDATQFHQMGTALYQVDSSASAYWLTPLKKANATPAMVLYHGTTAVPEPTTIVLTGSALVAGAICVYLGRHRKPCLKIAV